MFQKLAAALGNPDWATDPRFASNRSRLNNKAELVGLMDAILRRERRAHWIERLESVGVPAAPINTLPGALEEPQVKALGILSGVPGEDYRLTASPLSFDGVRLPILSCAPRLGSATAAALDSVTRKAAE